MRVLKYLNSKNNSTALEELKEEYGIKYSWDERYPSLYVLNYSQHKKPEYRFSDIVKECRSLVIEYCSLELKFKVVSRGFDRFFNYGESEVEVPFSGLTGYEKRDGSFLCMFYYQGEWLWRTTSMIKPEGVLYDFDKITWKDLVEPILPDIESASKLSLLYDDRFFSNLLEEEDLSLMFEITSNYNKIVHNYTSTELTLLAGRFTDGYYLVASVADYLAEKLKVNRPKTYTFDSGQEAQEAADNLPNLQEGFVFYSAEDGDPIYKVKSKEYVKAHHVKGEETLTVNKVINIIAKGEEHEYTTYFPETTSMFEECNEKIRKLKTQTGILCGAVLGYDPKGRAEALKDYEHKHLVFQMLKGLTFEEVWDKLSLQIKKRILFVK